MPPSTTSTLRQFSCGGAAVPPQLIRRARQVLDNCIAVRVYGSTEVPLMTYGWRDDPELAAFTDEWGLARQKIPERIELVAELPRTPSGKVRKDLLREQLKS